MVKFFVSARFCRGGVFCQWGLLKWKGGMWVGFKALLSGALAGSPTSTSA